ncbi:MAG: hypothetical protein M1818_005685 [Claussenomyces sp. TS43310]|nr:MAG: hypothetical protein M1818_005685 [Claussenomyces sp. TS43310]
MVWEWIVKFCCGVDFVAIREDWERDVVIQESIASETADAIIDLIRQWLAVRSLDVRPLWKKWILSEIIGMRVDEIGFTSVLNGFRSLSTWDEITFGDDHLPLPYYEEDNLHNQEELVMMPGEWLVVCIALWLCGRASDKRQSLKNMFEVRIRDMDLAEFDCCTELCQYEACSAENPTPLRRYYLADSVECWDAGRHMHSLSGEMISSKGNPV